jgi:CheY-like chemotaxis protein/HPt (histidine-containing phosphotransfer) domain-containing protein
VALKILNRLGYHADTVGNGQEAVDISKSGKYDLILMDCQMPELDGYSATEFIRTAEKQTGKHTVIIAMTAHALKGDREKCLAAGMDDYLTKPIDMKALNDMLEKWIVKIDEDNSRSVFETASVHTSDFDVIRNDIRTKSKSSEKKYVPMEKRAKIIDAERIKDVFGDNTDAIKQFIDLFLKSTEETLVEIDTVIQAKDQDAAKKLFHRLKGSAGNSGMMIMHELCISAEQMVLKVDWPVVDEIFKSIKDQFEQIKIEFAKLYQ